MRLEVYLTFIKDLAKSDIRLMKILIEKKILTRFMDLMGKYNPSQQFFNQANPPLEGIIETIGFIVRSIPCIIDPSELPEVKGVDPNFQIYELMQERGHSSFYQPLQSHFSMVNLTEKDQFIVLPQDCTNALFLKIKQFKPFYLNASKNGWKIDDFSRTVAHICYKNKDYSKKMAKHILKGTNKSTTEELINFLELMKSFLSVDDEYFDLRMEWIFGIADPIVKTQSYQVY
jgi:hypothetical protein